MAEKKVTKKECARVRKLVAVAEQLQHHRNHQKLKPAEMIAATCAFCQIDWWGWLGEGCVLETCPCSSVATTRHWTTLDRYPSTFGNLQTKSVMHGRRLRIDDSQNRLTIRRTLYEK